MFVLFIIYWDLLSIYAFCVELYIMLEHSGSGWSFLSVLRLAVLILNSLQAIFSSLLVALHLILIKDNKLIFENENALSVYDVGKAENFLQVFGTNKLLWLLPVFPESTHRVDGIYWPKNK